jgi:hypothetical protein
VIRTAGPAVGLRACLRAGGHGGPLRLIGRWQVKPDRGAGRVSQVPPLGGEVLTTMVTVPPSTPDLVCWTALVTISEVSKVAASWSAPTWCELSVRATKALAVATCSGRPGMVSEPRTVARVPPAVPRGPDPRRGPDHDRRELPSGVSILNPSKLLQVAISPVGKPVS